MRIACPFCGERDIHEFAIRGELARGPRPDPMAEDAEAQFFDFAYLRDNPASGPVKEHWYHANGCRRWLLVERDLSNHAILAVTLAEGAGL